MSDKKWRLIQIACYLIIFVGGFFVVYTTSKPVGNGVWKLVERPWWLNWYIVLGVISCFIVVLVEVRSRNGGVINAKVIGQSLLWIGITVGGLMYIWYLRGEFN